MTDVRQGPLLSSAVLQTHKNHIQKMKKKCIGEKCFHARIGHTPVHSVLYAF